MKPDIRILMSIIVPVYNVELYLDECVKSILNQTYKHLEIILVDDGSTDNSGKICDQYKEKDSRITVIHKQNGGLSDARNTGLAAATGEYVLFVDSDDYIDSDTCEVFFNGIKNNQFPDILIGNGKREPGGVLYNWDNISLFEKERTGSEYLKFALLNNCFNVCVPFNMYNREFLLKNNLSFKYGILHEDVRFTLPAFCLAERVVCVSQTFYHYRNNPTSIMNRKDYRKNCTDIYNTCLYHEKYLLDKLDVKTYNYVMDWLVKQYLGIFRRGKCYQYGKEFIHKSFVLKHMKTITTFAKAVLFCLSPQIYCNIRKRY